MKKNTEWFTECLPPAIAALAIKNIDPVWEFYVEEAETGNDALRTSFKWKNTEEGWYFWHAVKEELYYGTTNWPSIPVSSEDKLTALKKELADTRDALREVCLLRSLDAISKAWDILNREK